MKRNAVYKTAEMQEARTLMAAGVPLTTIARVVGVNRNTTSFWAKILGFQDALSQTEAIEVDKITRAIFKLSPRARREVCKAAARRS